ncbi:hypothetical protein [Moraxella lacunata]|uniref:hypothetical protein n=1 Tax=Moraxella lacunata TaxID=477 RepID=UPI003EE33683
MPNIVKLKKAKPCPPFLILNLSLIHFLMNPLLIHLSQFHTNDFAVIGLADFDW